MKKILLLLLTCLLSASVWSDELAKPDCAKPDIPSEFASEVALKSFDRHLREYKKCIDKFIAEQRDIAKTSAVLTTANNANDSAEMTVKEYNDFAHALRDRNQKATGENN